MVDDEQLMVAGLGWQLGLQLFVEGRAAAGGFWCFNGGCNLEVRKRRCFHVCNRVYENKFIAQCVN